MSSNVRRPAGSLRTRLAGGPPLLLDGALGTELERRGVRTGLPLWSAHALVEAPEQVEAIHADYLDAGAELLTANTFRSQRRSLDSAGLGERAAQLTALAVQLARRAARRAPPGRRIWVAGSAPPLEDCYRPDLVPGEAALAAEHAEHARHLTDAGVDLILAETMNSVRESVAALRAAREAGAEAAVSFVCGDDARLLSGEALDVALRAVADFEPVALMVNCLPPSAVTPCLAPLRSAGIPFGVYANLGAPRAKGSLERSEDRTPAEFAALAADWVSAGARAVGGCCGTTPAHIRAACARLRQRPATAR